MFLGLYFSIRYWNRYMGSMGKNKKKGEKSFFRIIFFHKIE